MRSLLQSLKSPQEILTLARSQSKLYQIERLTCFGATEAFFKDNRGADLDAKLFINSIPSQTLADNDVILLEGLYGDLLNRIVLELTEAEKSEDLAAA